MNNPNDNPMSDTTPCSVESEEAVLGSILTDESMLDEVSFLLASDFYILRNAWVYEAMLSLRDKQSPIDNLTLVEELRARRQLDDIGGPSYLTMLMNNTPTHIHAVIYANVVRRQSVRRKWLECATKIGQIALQDNVSEDDINAAVESEYYAAQSVKTDYDIVTMESLSLEHFDMVEYRYNHPNEQIGLPTGYTELDTILDGGAKPGDLVIIAARPGFGKTALGMGIARHAAELNKAFGGVSMEMPPKQLYHRIASAEAGIPSSKLIAGRLDDNDWDRYTKAMTRLQSLPMYFTGTATKGVADCCTKLRKMKSLYNIQGAFVDYIQLMVQGERGVNESVEIGRITRSLKLLALELSIPIYGLCQLNRGSEQTGDKRPTLVNLRGSGAIEQDADTVIFIHPNTDNPALSTLIVAKQRNGPLGDATIGFYPDLVKFYNVKTQTVHLGDI